MHEAKRVIEKIIKHYDEKIIKNISKQFSSIKTKQQDNSSNYIYRPLLYYWRWCKNWKKRNWKKSNGDDVLNVDLIACLDKYYCGFN